MGNWWRALWAGLALACSPATLAGCVGLDDAITRHDGSTVLLTIITDHCPVQPWTPLPGSASASANRSRRARPHSVFSSLLGTRALVLTRHRRRDRFVLPCIQESTRDYTFANGGKDLLDGVDNSAGISRLLDSSHERDKVSGMKALVAVSPLLSLTGLGALGLAARSQVASDIHWHPLLSLPVITTTAHLERSQRRVVFPARRQERRLILVRASETHLHLHPALCRTRARPHTSFHQHVSEGPQWYVPRPRRRSQRERKKMAA